MAIYRDTGAVTDGIFLIDSLIWNIEKQHAVYVITSSEKNALIDTGIKRTTNKILTELNNLGIENLDFILITHSHLDHCEAIHQFAKKFPEAEIGIPHLAHELIERYERQSSRMDLTNPFRLLREGTIVKLDSERFLTVIETPGHISDHISLLDETRKIIFVGDACGAHHLGENFSRPTAYAPDFNHDDYINTLMKFQKLNPFGLGIASYGFATDQDANNCVEAAVRDYNEWKRVIVEVASENPDENYIAEVLLRKFGRSPGEIREDRPNRWVKGILRGLARGFINSLKLGRD